MSHAMTASPKPFFRTLEGRGCCGQQKKYWMDNIKEWRFLPMPELLAMAFHGKDWKRISAEASLMSLR